MKKLLFLLCFLPQLIFAQSSIAKETLKKIDLKDDPVKSVFLWITDNIRYDVQKANQINDGISPVGNKKFKNEVEFDEYQLKTLMSRKKGVCQDYSLLFHSIMEELGYESYRVSGYIKKKGKVNTKIGHQWNAIKIDGEWRLFDATWSAGYVKDGKKFVKKYFPEWYDVEPKEMIKTHMPYDPIWQLSDNPINYKTFENNNTLTDRTAEIDHKAMIEMHINKSRKEQLKEQLDRSRALGDGIRLIEKWRRVKTKNLSNYDINSQPELIAGLNEKGKASVDLFNDYIKAKNNRFKSKKWTIPYATKSLETSKQQLNEVIDGYKSLDVTNKKSISNINKSIRITEQLLKRVESELKFLKTLK